MNEITKTERYVSVFENPEKYNSKIKIADALSRTQFVPDAFRGKAEDCLVALDMAARLDLNPLAVFPDIYVIDNRASFSSKFLIALVNRSGRFSRIKFDEGVDGETEVTFSGWGDQRGQRKTWKEKVPNYYSIASFTELSSGETFTSPRVDIKFAEKNGWVQKNGSKWQTMPQIMCRYRSASILIKSTCPEIVMGMEWADDLQDAREEPVEYDDAHWLHDAIANAKTPEELADVGKIIAQTNVSPNELRELRAEYKNKTFPSLVDQFKRRIAEEGTTEALRNEIEIATTTGKLKSQEYGELIENWEIQDAEVEDVSQEPVVVDGTDEQKNWGRQMCESIKAASSIEIVDSNLNSAHEWLESGYITPSIYQKIVEFANQVKSRF